MVTLYYIGDGLARHDGKPLSRGDSIEVPEARVDDFLATGLFTLDAPESK